MKNIPFQLRTEYTASKLELYISSNRFKNAYSVIFLLQFVIIFIFELFLLYLSTLVKDISVISYFLLFVMILATSYSLFADGQFNLDNNKFKFSNFIYSGLFSKEERDNIAMQLVKNYCALTIPLICSLFFSLIYIFARYLILANISIFTLAIPIVFGIVLLLHSFYIIKMRVLKTLNISTTISTNWEIKLFTSSLFSVGIYAFFMVFNPIDDIQTLTREFSIFEMVNVMMLLMILIIGIRILNRFFHHSFDKKNTSSPKAAIIRIKDNNPIFLDFWEAELKNRIHLFPYVCLILRIIPIMSMSKIFIFTPIYFILFSQFNMRYLLNDKFFNFNQLFGRTNKYIAYQVFKPTFRLHITLICISSILILFNIHNFLEYLMLCTVMILLFIITFAYNIFFYSLIPTISGSTHLKITQLEKLSGIIVGLLFLIGMYIGVK